MISFKKIRDIDLLKVCVPACVGIFVFLFWFVLYPQYLSYQEQYQLFLWTGDYFVQSIQVAGGFLQYLGEFIVQFYAIEWLGALLLALVFVALQVLSLALLPKKNKWVSLALSLMPVVLMIYMMGDENVMLAFPLSVISAMGMALLMRKVSIYFDLLVIPCLYWLIGPMVWLYVILRLAQCRKMIYTAALLYVAAVQLLAYNTVLQQWPLRTVMLEMGYYRYAEGFAIGDFGFDKEKYELMKQDYLIRNQRWNDIIRNAEQYTVETPFWSESVNLALAMTGQLSQRQFAFYQSGSDALIMQMYRDMTSNLPTMEAFYRLGMTNECLRYAFDLQESIPYGKKSGRLTKRIIECCLVSGRYDVAKKHLNLLKKSLFYSKWAKNTEQFVGNEQMIDSHPVYGKMRQNKFQNNFLFYYPELAKVFYQLFMSNTDNKMALEYMLGQVLLEGEANLFLQLVGAVNQFGGYSGMPFAYQDAINCIQARGNAPGSRYGEYAKRMKGTMNQSTEMLNSESAH